METIGKCRKTDKRNAAVIGLLFIIADIAAIIGLILYSPILEQSNYLILGYKHSSQIILGAIFELILACSAIGTSIMFFPYLRKFNESLALGYVCFRLLEVVFILVGIVSVLSLLTLSHSFSVAIFPDVSSYKTVGVILKAVHDWTFILGPNFMLGVNTFIYSYILYRSKLIPRKISSLGILGGVLIFIAALLEMFGIILQVSLWGVLLAMPTIIYELTLAIWLIIKGFDHDSLMQKRF